MAFAKLLYPFAVLLVLAPLVHAAEPGVPLSREQVIRDGDVGISRGELEQIISRWSTEMRQAAANDYGDRLELLNMALMNKKLAALAEAMTPEEHGEAYWKLHFQLQGRKRQAAIDHFLASIEVPDMAELARERYDTEKDRYARVPEQRLTSHILFPCPAGQCNREELRPVASEVLERLRAGADFEVLVAEHSQDPGSKDKGGRYDTWFSLGQQGVEPRYTGGAFDIEELGGYSGLVETQFGIHIIRLDDIREPYYKTYDEVRDTIVATLTSEFRKLAAQDFEASLAITDDAYINGLVVEELLAPFKAGN
jgi:peptidyl-prolyl cis-trans isomerase C